MSANGSFPISPVMARLAAGLVLSAMIGWVAYRRASLSGSGVAGAVIVGTLTFGFGGWGAGLLLISFFVSSSALSHFKRANVRKLRASQQFEKGGRRDAAQVFANGGVGCACVIVAGLAEASGQTQLAWLAFGGFLGAVATVNADTWATEVGVLSRSSPRLITDLRREVEPGASGGVSRLGTLAALSGAAFIAAVFVVLQIVAGGISSAPLASASLLGLAMVTTIGGVAGSLFDSLLGAVAQAQFADAQTATLTERAISRDGAPNRLVRGMRWMNNDWVNFFASAAGALLVAAAVAGFGLI